jgi:hypothetical protein
MTRFPSLASGVLAASLAILPVAAFAQQGTPAVQTPAPATEVSKTPGAVTPNHAAQAQSADTGVKTPEIGKTVPVKKPDHTRLIAPAHPLPAKAAEPSKS